MILIVKVRGRRNSLPMTLLLPEGSALAAYGAFSLIEHL